MLKLLVFSYLFVLTFCDSVLKDDLKQQSFLYAIAFVSEDSRHLTTCNKQLKEFTHAVDTKELWALRMLDASGQQETGYLFGHTLWLGSFSQCRDIFTKHGLITKKPQILPKNAFPPFEVKFMTAVLNHNNTIQIQFRIPTNEYIHLGFCMPKSCTTEELTEYLDKILKNKILAIQQMFPVYLSISGVKSLGFETINWIYDPMILITIIIFTITIILCGLGTWYDLKYKVNLIKEKDEKKVSNENIVHDSRLSFRNRILLCFSVYRNTRTIFTINFEPKTNNIPFVHGLKAWFMFYIVLLHAVLYQNFFTENANTAYRMAAMFINQILSNASYSVDTYFCLGGFLISYLFYKSHNGKPFSLMKSMKMYSSMIIHRYIRLTPTYIAMLLITYTIWQFTAHEYPLIHRVPLERVEIACSRYWWRNLLYITTMYSRADMCMSWSWYLSNDMQFYVVNCALLLLSTVYLKQILFIFGLLPVISIISGSLTSYMHKYVPTLEEQILQLEIMYDPFLIRMGPYFVGVLAGYYTNKWNNTIPLKKTIINKISYGMLLIAIFIIHGVYTRDNLPIAYVAIYMGVSRTLWGVCTAWLIVLCLSGNAGFINTFLSFRAWIPISRLTYCLFLVHPVIIVMFGLTGDQGAHMTYPAIIQSSFGIFTVSLIAAYIVSVLFESPYVLLSKLMYKKDIK